MDPPPLVSRLFRELARHPTCRQISQHRPYHQRYRSGPSLPSNSNARGDLPGQHRPYPSHGFPSQPVRSYAVRGALKPGETTNESRWQQRSTFFPDHRHEEFASYPTLTLNDLKARHTRPRRVKMLLRDFIDDSLYNPSYGYFSKEAVIFSPGDAFNFPAMQDNLEFYTYLGHRYTDFEDELDAAEGVNPIRQVWHTPTELFRPFYGEAMARYLVSNYRLTSYPYEDLIIYEMGAGRGTLMNNILDYIREADPSVYERTRYRIIEISPALADIQRKTLTSEGSSRAGSHGDRVEIINRSIFEWDEPLSSPCFFIAMEVFDNFSHDGVRYDVSDNGTVTPYQAHVVIDDEGDFFDVYSPTLDPILARFLRAREAATAGHYPRPYPTRRLLQRLRRFLPFQHNLSEIEYVPTRLLQFFDVLDRYFPAHRLLASDFHSLPQAIRGLHAPVVQTRFQRTMVPVTTPLVHQGYFDILFPTDFAVMENMYRAVTGKFSRVSSHADFMRSWAFLEETETRSGENPLLDYYKNASVLVTL